MSVVRSQWRSIQRIAYRAIRNQLDALEASELKQQWGELIEHGYANTPAGADQLAKIAASIHGGEPRTYYENMMRATADWIESTASNTDLTLLIETIAGFHHRCAVFVLAELVGDSAGDARGKTAEQARTACEFARDWATHKRRVDQLKFLYADLNDHPPATPRRESAAEADRRTSVHRMTRELLPAAWFAPELQQFNTGMHWKWSRGSMLVRRTLALHSVVQGGSVEDLRGGLATTPDSRAAAYDRVKAEIVQAIRVYSTFWWD